MNGKLKLGEPDSSNFLQLVSQGNQNLNPKLSNFNAYLFFFPHGKI